jgi:Zn-dependent peptidase ImmA (M78 family)
VSAQATKVAVARARKLLREYAIEEVPIPVEYLAEELGAELLYRTLEGDISGILYRDEPGRTVIGINAWDSRTRQRFTIAHELGHLLLHPGQPVIVDKLVKINFRRTPSMPVAGPTEEQQANAFAAELLMPERLVKDTAREIVGDNVLFSSDDLVHELAQLFDVSPQSMGYRLVNLRLLDSLAIEG